MKILVINRGSSSLRCSLYDWASLPEHVVPPVWETHMNFETMPSAAALRSAIDALISQHCSLSEIDIVGHRVVHGGKLFEKSTFLGAKVKEQINQLSKIDPLHPLTELEVFGNIPQIAVFDTAFHHTLPQAAAVYPGPYKWFEEGIQKYGFHGISFQYCSRRCSEMLGPNLKMVICHLGSGASLCAVDKGKSIDTTMGLTTLEGLMMDTRCGSIDPGIILHLLKTQSPEQISTDLYRKSGLLGVSGISSDMRQIIENIAKPRAALALEVYLHRLNSLIGSMIASLQGLDVLVFTAGIGENSPLIRQRVCDNFDFLGADIDKKKNETVAEDSVISSSDSKIKVMMIHTQEAFEIARECWTKQTARN